MKRFIWETLRRAGSFITFSLLRSGAGLPVLSGGLQVRLYQEPRASLLTEAKRKVGLLVPESSFDFDYYLIILIVVVPLI